MYTYIRAVGALKSGPTGQHLFNVENYKVSDIFKHFQRMTVVIKNSFYDQDVALDLWDYQNELEYYDNTLQTWLDTKASEILITSNTLPGGVLKPITAFDAQYHNLRIFPGDVMKSDNSQTEVDVNNAPDIRLRHKDMPTFKYDQFVKTTLFTINGHFVRGVHGDKDVFLIGAGKHYRIEKNIHINCLNFYNRSTLTTAPIQIEDITVETPDTGIVLRVKFKESIAKKLVWMVIAGQLYIDDIVKPVSDNSVMIAINNVDIITKLFIAQDYINVDGIIDQETRIIPGDVLKTKEFYEKLLTHFTSFSVVLDNPNISVTVEPLQTFTYPTAFLVPLESNNLPLMLNNGLFPAYLAIRASNKESLLKTDISISKNFLNKTTGTGNGGNAYHSYASRYYPADRVTGYFFKINALS